MNSGWKTSLISDSFCGLPQGVLRAGTSEIVKILEFFLGRVRKIFGCHGSG